MKGKAGVGGLMEADEHNDQTSACSVNFGLKAKFGVRREFWVDYMG